MYLLLLLGFYESHFGVSLQLHFDLASLSLQQDPLVLDILKVSLVPCV